MPVKVVVMVVNVEFVEEMLDGFFGSLALGTARGY